MAIKYRLMRIDKSTNKIWWVSERPGEGGVDWGYEPKESDAQLLNEYWKRRFLKDMQRVNDKGIAIPVAGSDFKKNPKTKKPVVKITNMREIILEQLESLQRKGYSPSRAGAILTTIDAAAGGKNSHAIKRAVAEIGGKALSRNPRKKKATRRAKMATRIINILKVNPVGRTFRVFARKKVQGKEKYYYWTGDSFDSNYTLSFKYPKADAIAAMKLFSKKYPKTVFGVSDGKA